jgi:hypothetical protein
MLKYEIIKKIKKQVCGCSGFGYIGPSQRRPFFDQPFIDLMYGRGLAQILFFC